MSIRLVVLAFVVAVRCAGSVAPSSAADKPFITKAQRDAVAASRDRGDDAVA